MKGIPIRFILLALLLEVLFFVSTQAVGAGQIITAIVILLLAGALYVIGVYWTVSIHTSEGAPLFIFIIAVGLMFRITMWPLAYPSTDDAYRYRWEGKLQANSGNPYRARPSDPDLTPLRDSTYPRIGLKDFKGGYGPAWEMVSAAMYLAISSATANESSQVFWFKLPAVIGDLGLIAAVTALLRASGLPVIRVLIYAWSPLPVWEFWANGHNDALVVLATVLAILWALRGRPWRAACFFGLATALKFWPGVLLGVFIRAGLGWRHFLVSLSLFVLFAAPYWTGVTENAQFMSGFIGGWRNNDSLFGAILWLAGDIYRAKYAAFGIIGVLSTFVALRQPNLTRAALWTVVTMLLVVSNCHPWYLTWVLPFLAVYPSPGLVLWTVLVPLFYGVWPGWIATGIWDGLTPSRWLVYGPVMSFLVGRLMYALAVRRSKQQDSISPN